MTLVNPQTSRPEDVFQDFFRSYQADQVGSKYRKRLAQVAVNNGISLVIDFDDLIAFDPALARSVTERPDDYVGYASSAATAQMRVEDPEYAEHAGRIFARFRRLPEKRALRKIGAEDMKKLALVEGIVVRTTQVRPMILKAVFRCRKCLEIVQEEQSGDLMRGPGPTCPSCKQKTAWELLEEQCKFKNTQEARVQERPEDLPPGQLPRYLDVRLEDDIVDSARPGDRVAVTSIVRAEKQYVGEKGRLRTFNLYLEANFVDVVGKETEVVEITREDEKKILEASKDPFVHRKLIMSLAPSIYGYGEIKEGILYLLFGGVSKHLPDGVSIRGDLNTLLIGDPGTAKSQLLQYVSRIAPRGLYTSGRGTTAAGLCVDKDSMVVTRQGIRAIGDVIEEQLKDNDARSETGETIALEPSPSEIIAPIVEDRVLNEPRGSSLLLRNVSLTSLGFSKVTQYYRLRSPVLIRIRTVLGKEILLTPETQVGCYDQEGRLAYWKRAEDVREEDRLLISRHLQDPGRLLRIRMLEFADEDDFVRLEAHAFARLRSVLQREYSTLREAARAIGILEDKLYHRWRRKGLRLRDLKKITRVLGVGTFSELEPYVREIAYKSYRGIETVQVPRNLTQLMELVGCLYADGCITEDKRGGGRGLCVRFTSGDYAECERYCGLLRSLFGLTPTIKKEKDEHCYDVRFTNKIVGRLLRSLGLPVGVKMDSMQMDPAISSAPNDLLAAFLRGLISHDGWVSNRKNVGFSTSSKRLAIQVDLCLQRFGIVTALRKRRPKVTAIQGKLVRSKGNYELSIYDGESLKTFQEQIGFPQSTKSQKLVALIALKKFNHSNFIRIGHDMISVRVKRISREAANAEVYDLTVEGSHSFLANGFIVHNTAAVLREKTGGMVLEAGALVLADKGIACIDELDKMRPDDRVAIHEALEQQTVSVAKGGIVATLNARAAVLAAANPALGRYEPHKNINENINLPVTILSRFDLIFLVKDLPEPENDSRMSEHILSLHKTKHTPEEAPFPPDFLRKYISYAKRIAPVLTPEAVKELQDFYLKMRNTTGKEAAVAITPRQLEGLVRISEARARAFLREEVTVEDAKSAVKIMSYALYDVGVDVKTGKIDIDTIMTGKPATVRDSLGRVMAIVAELERETGTVEEKILTAAIVEREKVTDGEARRFVGQLIKEGMIYSPKEGKLKRTSG